MKKCYITGLPCGPVGKNLLADEAEVFSLFHAHMCLPAQGPIYMVFSGLAKMFVRIVP